MLEDHAKVLTVLQHAGEVIGRKKLQKMLYILKKLNYPFREKYAFHFFGPYSEELTLQIEELSNLQFIDELKERQGGYHQYRYQITTAGRRFLENYDFHLPDLDHLVSFLNAQSSRFLELVSTAFYFDDLSCEEIREKIQTVKAKQNYTEEEVNKAFEFIHDLKRKQPANQLIH